MNEYYVPPADITAGIRARSAYINALNAAVDAGFDAIPADLAATLAAIVAGSGVLVSAADTTVGVLDGKLLEGAMITFTIGSAGGNETLTISANLVGDVSPQLGAQLDVNGFGLGDGTLELLSFSETASAVNELTIKNAATGDGPELQATGDDTDIDLVLRAKGTGDIKVEADIDLNGNQIPELLGGQTIFIPAGAMTSRDTSGAELNSIETSTNKIMVQTMDFDPSSDEFIQFPVRMPKGWNAGTITCSWVWSHATTTTNFDVQYMAQAVAIRNGSLLDTAFGTAVGHTLDTGGTTDTLYTTDTAIMTVSNTPTKEDYLIIQSYRDVSEDTLAIDSRLHGMTALYTEDSHTDD